MTKQERNPVDGNSGEQHLQGERIAEHVGMAALSLAVGGCDIRRFEQTSIASLPIGNGTLRISIAFPKESRD
jgi:hypothetical protein